MDNLALYYGKIACDTMMRKYGASELPPKGFHYHQGVFLSGMMNVYSLCGEEKYYNYMKDWVDSIIPEPGVIHWFSKGALDEYMSGILLFPLYERTHDQKYLAALQLLMGNIRNWRRNEKGGFWHMEWMANQMWLDGLYMVGPLQAMYAEKFNDSFLIKQAVDQVLIMYENMQDKKTKLLYHAWDASKTVKWANPETGLSEEFWGRSLGWYVVAILDIMEHMDKRCEEYGKLAMIEREVLQAIISYQDQQKKLWYQVVDKGDVEGNWLEASCSCLFTYAIAKAVRMGIMDTEVLESARAGFHAVIKEFTQINGEDLLISGVCVGTGVNNYQGYIERPTSINDLHGMGAFLLMCAEIARTC